MREDLYKKLFDITDPDYRYFRLSHLFGLKVIVGKDSDSVCVTLLKDNISSSYTWSIAMLNTLSDDILIYTVDNSILRLINDIGEFIINETKL